MPLQKIQGLQGLPGLNRLSAYQQEAFYNANKSILNTQNFRRLRDLDRAAEILYNNQQFVNKFGQDKFNELNNGTEEAYNLRNNILKTTIVDDIWNKTLSPFKEDGTRDNSIGLGALWEKYNEMSTDAKLSVLESNWLTPTEFNKGWKDYEDAVNQKGKVLASSGAGAFMPSWVAVGQPMLSTETPQQDNKGAGLQEAIKALVGEEGSKRFAAGRNDNIIETIYNNDLKDKTYALSDVVNRAYISPEISSKSDDEINQLFYKNFIDENSDMVKLGAGTLAAYYGSSELKDLSVDDKRQWLAKKAAYMSNMSPGSAATALNNEAKEYVTAHQGSGKRAKLFIQDVGISALSYTVDKVNGIYNLALLAEDKSSLEKPTVFVDDKGNIVDPKTKFTWDANGMGHYTDSNGEDRTVHKTQVARTTLHNMGKNFDGSDDNGWFNPLYWSRAEQFGTLDEEEQKQFEKLGASPYKVSYNPNDESDLWYEAFKMMSFGAADAASMLIPFGVGAVGRSLSAASKAGKIVTGLGDTLNDIGRFFSNPVLQGSLGASGIAYAYGRGAFQETLAQNLSNAEEVLSTIALNDVQNDYNSNAEFKATVDAEINKRATALKDEYLKQLKASDSTQSVDEKTLNEQCLSQAKETYMNELVQEHTDELRQGKDWAQLQDEAIKGAGDAAINTFLPEAIKYAFINNLGFRKFLYTNPTGFTKKVSSAFKGIREITTKDGAKRLVTDTSKFLTKKQKLAQFGKTAINQVWGGAWTNGTDDMMTDAAERINEDSYSRYLNGYLNDEAIADVYGFADGIHSYFAGFSNSWGQETTWNATVVGVLGSVVSSNINFANLAHLATAEGRAAYKNNFQQRYKRNEDGTLTKGEDGKPIIEQLGWKDNWRERAAYFLQNGVLNTYYGKKQAARDLQSHADYVNNILDNYNDFEDLYNIAASSRLVEESLEEGGDETAKVLKAIHVVNALNNLANNSKDPAGLSSVVQNAKNLVDNLAEMEYDADSENHLPEGEEIQSILSQYYAANSSVAQNAHTAKQGLASVINNAKTLKGVAEQYNAAEREIQRAEATAQKSFPLTVRERLKINKVLDGTWRTKLAELQEAVGDSSTASEVSQDNLIATVGGKKNAQHLMKVYAKQEEELNQDKKKQEETVAKKKKAYDMAVQVLRNNTDSSAQYGLQKKVEKAFAEYENKKQQLNSTLQDITLSQKKANQLSEALKVAEVEGYKDKVLTAEEIMALDPITRARMMRNTTLTEDNNGNPITTTRDVFSKEQQAEIEKLEQQLLMKNPDALKAIQDIALYTQRLKSNQDSYVKLLQHPEAAAISLENQRAVSAKSAYRLINRRNAQTIADRITNIDRATAPHKEITQAEKDKWVYNELRKYNPTLLNTIADYDMVPKYQKQLDDAKDWTKIVADLAAIIDKGAKDRGDAWEVNMLRNLDTIIGTANTREEVLTNMEKAVEDIEDPAVTADLEFIMQGLNDMKYQRAATVLEKINVKKEREAAAKKKREEEKKAADEAAQAAAAAAAAKAEAEANAKATAEAKAAEEAAKAEEAANAQTEHPVPANGEGLIDGVEAEHHVDEHSVEDESKRQNVDLWGEGSEGGDRAATEETTSFPSQIKDEGEEVAVQSPDLKDQASESEDNKVHTTEEAESNSTANTQGERITEFHVDTLSGNAMSEYNPKALVEEGRLEHKKGASPQDSMNRFYGWMESAGIHLQNIIDHELAQILEKNPHAKVKFMTVNPANNATHDVDVQSHLFLVLDYDSDINKGIEGIHKAENGGVIESEGKKYLIIGVAGYQRGNTAKQALYDILNSNSPHSPNGYGLARKGRKKFFDEHPSERFMIVPDAETEIVPRSLIPGYLVRQLETDETVEFRNISELLKDKERNPHGLTLSDLVWGIQEKTEFVLASQDSTKPSEASQKVMVPTNKEENTGRVFALLPASNGKMVLSYMKPLFYNEMHDGVLKNEIMQHLNAMLSTDYETRLGAAEKLGQIFYLDSEGGDFFLLAKNKPIITLVHDGEKYKTFVLGEEFDRQAFFSAISDMNPRINVTRSALGKADGITKLEEAGALTTDVAMLGTAGSSYSIYGVDAQGKMLQPTTPSNPAPQQGNSDFRATNRSQVVYNHRYYTFEDGKFFLNGIPVTDAATLEQLIYNQRIIEGGLKATTNGGVWDFYILTQGDNPEVVRVNKNTKEVKRCTTEEAMSLLNSLDKQQLDEQRRQNAEEALKKALEGAENVNLEGSAEISEDGATVIATEESKKKVRGRKQVQKAYAELQDAYTKKDYIASLNAINTINHNVTFGDEGAITAEEQAFVDKVTEEAKRNGYVIRDLLGMRYDEGLKVIADFVNAPTLPVGSVIISSVRLPQINKDGKMVQAARIIVKQNLPEESPSAPAATFTYHATSKTKSLSEHYVNHKFQKALLKLVKSKMKDAPKKIQELTEYLRKKDIEVDAIGTSEEDIAAWMKTIEECR